VTFGPEHYVFAGGRAFLASASELAAVQKVDPAKIVVRELIDEIRLLRSELIEAGTRPEMGGPLGKEVL
jgi:hypothetical protein